MEPVRISATSQEHRYTAMAKTYGFASAILPQEDLVVVEAYRRFCEENRCGNFGKNYSCPPYSGTVAEMHERMQQFTRALILRSDYTDIDAWDEAAMVKLKREHNLRTREMVNTIKKEEKLESLKDYLLMTAGPCSFCEHCLMPEKIPCPFVEERASCMSAYSVDVALMAEKAGWTLSWDRDKTSLFSLFLWNETAEKK